MDKDQQPFTAESVDDEIDRLTNTNSFTSSDINVQLLHGLRHVYTQDADSLKQVWERLERYSIQQQVSQVSREETTQRQAASHYILPTQKNSHSAKYPTSQPFTVLVASIIGALLVGSLAWVLTVTHLAGRLNTTPESSQSGIYVGNSTSITHEDLQMGKVLWTYNIPKAPESSLTHISKLIPAGNTVYALSETVSGQRTVVALDATNGKLRWQYPYTDDLNPDSIVLFNDTLYIGTNSGNIQVLNTTNGKQQTNYQVGANVRGMTVANGILYVSTQDGLSALNLADSKQIWHTSWPWNMLSDIGLTSGPLHIVDGVLYLAISHPNIYGSATIGGAAAFNANTGHLLWDKSAMHGQVYDLTVANDVVYFGTQVSDEQTSLFSGTLYALAAHTGNQIWPHPSSNGAIAIAPNVVDGVLYYSACPGYTTPYPGFAFAPGAKPPVYIVALDATNGSPKWQTQIGSGLPTTSSVLNGVFYITSDGTSFALNVKDGKQLWKYPEGDTASSMVVVA